MNISEKQVNDEDNMQNAHNSEISNGIIFTRLLFPDDFDNIEVSDFNSEEDNSERDQPQNQQNQSQTSQKPDEILEIKEITSKNEDKQFEISRILENQKQNVDLSSKAIEQIQSSKCFDSGPKQNEDDNQQPHQIEKEDNKIVDEDKQQTNIYQLATLVENNVIIIKKQEQQLQEKPNEEFKQITQLKLEQVNQQSQIQKQEQLQQLQQNNQDQQKKKEDQLDSENDHDEKKNQLNEIDNDNENQSQEQFGTINCHSQQQIRNSLLQSLNNQNQISQLSINHSPFPINKYDVSQLPSTSGNKRKFFTNPLPQDVLFQCTIIRSKKGLAKIYPVYDLFSTDQNKYMMTAKKCTLNSKGNYIITMEQDNYSTKSKCYLGKLRGNFMGTEYIFYDSGIAPKKSKETKPYREQYGVIYYKSNLYQNKGRQIKLFIPKVDAQGKSKQYIPSNNHEGIQFDINDETMKKMYIDEYVNMPPKWNKELKAYALNFYGRVEQPSMKNFQLIKEGEPEKIYLQFGRVNDITFNLDFTYPLSPIQAFQICISSIDLKFACQ